MAQTLPPELPHHEAATRAASARARRALVSLKRSSAVVTTVAAIVTLLLMIVPHGKTIKKSKPERIILTSISTTIAPQETSFYTVRPGDTLSQIARQFLHTANWQWLYQANLKVVGSDPNALRPGERIILRLTKPVTITRAVVTDYSPPVSSSSSPQRIAEGMLGSYGWGSDQMSCLIPLWERESGWNYTAENPDGAYGIPQSLPGDKMATAGGDWQTNPATQIRWGLGYIKASYGSPCGAWDHEEADGWY